jgi:NAD(P)-dependent dehydrogenase (short-subunit alcohol dehydrogenase family)
MKSFNGRIAAVTGGGTGMGRELVRQLVAEGCSVAMCDVSAATMAETKRLCAADGAPQGVRISAHVADVSDETQVIAFRDAVAREHDTDRIHLLFNNAGIGGGSSIVSSSREEWERTFNVNWYGVYYNTRAFLPLLMKADEAHIVNTSSINGFWACLMPGVSQSAYASAKFAVKGFTESLITDLRNVAPHIKASIVMPGHIGTDIGFNTRRVLTGSDSDEMSASEIAAARQILRAMDPRMADAPDEAIQQAMMDFARRFKETAPTSAAQAAKIILDGVKADRWRILVGDDAHRIDERVRANPEKAYELDFLEGFGAYIAADANGD